MDKVQSEYCELLLRVVESEGSVKPRQPPLEEGANLSEKSNNKRS